MKSGIYKFTYKNGVVIYVGSSVNMNKRKNQHINSLKNNKHHNFIFQRVFDKHKDDILFEIVEYCETESLLEREDYYIKTLKPFANISDARGSHPHTEEAKDKMRGRIVSQETKDKLSQALKGRESNRKGLKTNFIPSSAFKKGNIPWNKGLELKSSWNKGLELSESHKEKLKEAKRLLDKFKIGLIFKNWKILDYAESKKGRAWNCECMLCGNQQIIKDCRFKRDDTIICKNCKNKEVENEQNTD